MARSETGSMSYIEKQRQRIAELEGTAEIVSAVPEQVVSQEDPTVQSQEPPEPPASPTVDSPVVPSAPEPASTSTPDGMGEFREQLARMQRQLDSSQERVVPLQRQVSSLLSEVETLKQENANLKTARGNQGQAPQPSQDAEDDDPELREFIAEDGVYHDMTPGIKKLVAKMVKQGIEPLQAQVAPVLETDTAQRANAALAETRRKHLEPVFEKHPDAFEVVSSPDFDAFLSKMPSYIAPHMRKMFLAPENHEQGQLISVLDEYKKSRNIRPTPAPAPVPDPANLAVTTRRMASAPSPSPTAPIPLTKARVAQINRILGSSERNLYAPEAIAAMKAELDQGEMVAVQQGRGAVPTLNTLM
jgi:regulator of replication initiation timing